jgi:hypothetical protein
MGSNSRVRALVSLAGISLVLALGACGKAKVSGALPGPTGGSGGSSSGDGGGGPTFTLDGPIGTPVGDGGTVLPPPGQDPPPEDCGPGGTCKQGFICTVANKCGRAGNACTGPAECQGDTYCCGAGCRSDGKTDGVCIPGNVPPGLAAACKGTVVVGAFSPQIQCEWTDDTSSFVASSPVVADLPNDPTSPEIVFVSFGAGGDNANTGATPGQLRIIRGNDCKLLESITTPPVRANTTPALADLDGDGTVEIVALKDDGKPIAFKWNGTRYAQLWSAATGPSQKDRQMWSAVSIHNLDEDDTPEVLVGTSSAGAIHTFNGRTGTEIGAPVQVGTIFNGMIPIVGDLNNNGKPDLVTNLASAVYAVEWMGTGWQMPTGVPPVQVTPYLVTSHFALADFGTPMPGGGFDDKTLDGIAEIVATEAEIGGKVSIITLTGQVVMSVETMKDMGSAALNEGGGPPVIGDFDSDGFPEVGVAGASRFRVFDLGCRNGGAGCQAPFIKWSKPSQDASSRQTGASVFDFDGDGKAEAVYADECFLRVYDGSNGEVLFSTPRTSGTWYENPVIADVDRDDHAEIVVNSAYHNACPTSGMSGVPYVDPIHPGVRCLKTEDCVLGTTCTAGFCRCNGDQQCDKGLTCQPALAESGGASAGKVCRSTHPNPDPKTTPVKGGIKVVNDRLDRWASSLPIWNQHAYSITNVRPNGSIPKMSEWRPNWLNKEKGYNSFRQNAQGAAGAEDLADVTGKLDRGSICSIKGNIVTLTARVCNRGRRAVGSKLPATFYDAGGNVLCVSYTAEPVQGNDDCKTVSCEVDRSKVMGIIKMVVNDDGKGGRTTVECRADNNSDQLELKPTDCRID